MQRFFQIGKVFRLIEFKSDDVMPSVSCARFRNIPGAFFIMNPHHYRPLLRSQSCHRYPLQTDCHEERNAAPGHGMRIVKLARRSVLLNPSIPVSGILGVTRIYSRAAIASIMF
jgi:hypothetical protein